MGPIPPAVMHPAMPPPQIPLPINQTYGVVQVPMSPMYGMVPVPGNSWYQKNQLISWLINR